MPVTLHFAKPLAPAVLGRIAQRLRAVLHRRRSRHPFPSRRRLLTALGGAPRDVGAIERLVALFPVRSVLAYNAKALRVRARTKLAKLDRFGLLSGCGRAVDLGAGTGDFVAALAGRGIGAAGVERNPRAVTDGLRELGREVNGLCLGDAATLPFASGVFDLATA
ncbi:MAG: methyltransferase domain-containing protein, partial [Planctomycetes bacterium]|nr:methyltransferase domain-containing protein [Planctomycetota bacterium]